MNNNIFKNINTGSSSNIENKYNESTVDLTNEDESNDKLKSTGSYIKDLNEYNMEYVMQDIAPVESNINIKLSNSTPNIKTIGNRENNLDSDSNSDLENDGHDCVICLDSSGLDKKNNIKLNCCKNNYHFDCLETWFEKHNPPICPTCRHELNTTDISYISSNGFNFNNLSFVKAEILYSEDYDKIIHPSSWFYTIDDLNFYYENKCECDKCIQNDSCWRTKLATYYMLWYSHKSDHIGKLLIIFSLLVMEGLSTLQFGKLRICEDDALQYAEKVINRIV